MKKIRAVLFDLDGTLLPMDLDRFLKEYFSSLTAKAVAGGYGQKEFSRALMCGIEESLANDGKDTNEKVFWSAFDRAFGEKSIDRALFDEFYRDDFPALQSSCGYTAEARWAVQKIKELGFRVALATNPVFPAVATNQRVAWAGLSPRDFELVTTYENYKYAKPSIGYFLEVAKKMGVSPEECLVVGNDTADDMVAEQCGMRVFLLTDYLINRKGEDISRYPNGTYADLIRYAEELG